jgi:hypothetical protein
VSIQFQPAAPFPNALRLSSHTLNARKICKILSLRPCRTSLILTAPIFTSLSSKKSNSLNSPSSLSSLGPAGNAESGTGGVEDFPLIDSASRRSSSPPHNGPAGSFICNELGRCVFAHSIKLTSAAVGCWNPRSEPESIHGTIIERTHSLLWLNR